MQNARRMVGRLAVLATIGCGGGDEGTAPQNLVAVNITATLATLRPGQTSQFTAVGVDAQGNPVSGGGAASWQSSAPSVATVDGNGVVRGVAVGSSAIQATIRGVSGSRIITVLPAGAGAVVTMPGLSFSPFTVTINRTETVFFDFPQLAHNVIFNKKAGVPADIESTSGQTVSRRFDTAGSFSYDCTLHPGMSGVVVVQ